METPENESGREDDNAPENVKYEEESAAVDLGCNEKNDARSLQKKDENETLEIFCSRKVFLNQSPLDHLNLLTTYPPLQHSSRTPCAALSLKWWPLSHGRPPDCLSSWGSRTDSSQG